MGNELVKVSPGVEVKLEYPDNIVRDVVSAAGYVVMSAATALIREGIHATVAVVQAVEQTRVEIALYREQGRMLREYVIPTVALYDAIQSGRHFISSSGWDEDLKRMALEDLDRKLQKYRTR
jgi:hypothetical protein